MFEVVFKVVFGVIFGVMFRVVFEVVFDGCVYWSGVGVCGHNWGNDSGDMIFLCTFFQAPVFFWVFFCC